MAQDPISKKAKPVPARTDPTSPQSSPIDADAVLAVSPASSFETTTEQFIMKPAENTEPFTVPPDDGDAPEVLVHEGEQDTAVVHPGPAQATDYLGKTRPMRADQAEALKKKAAGAATTDAGQSAAETTLKTTVLGDYRLLKKLGQGGMGAVYKALQVKFDREVAVKILSKELAGKESFVKRFEREAKVMAKLDHPNILRCIDVGEAHGYHYLVMEFVDGGSIEGFLRKFHTFTIGDALHIVLACAAALDHAHELGLVHRDIKPDNVLVTKKGVVKVADLGLAKATADDMSLTKTGTGAGTPIYMAPEQARDAKHVDGKVDIYALGCMLYVLLTGEAPFKGETLVELIEAKETGKFAPIRKFNVDVPERLDLIVDKMLAQNPQHRYASCAEIIAEIKGLGLHNDHLSFLEEANPSPAKAGVNKSAAPGKATDRPQVMGGKTTSVPAGQTFVGQSASSDDLYYWKFKNDEGKSVTKKLKKEQLIMLIKTSSIDTHAHVSRDSKSGYRALGTYVEFSNLFRGASTKKQADRKGEKFREVYKELARQEVSRLRWRWFHNLYLRAGGLLGFILWLIVLGGVLVGGFFLVRFLINFVGEKLAKSGQL